jgi:hypothetical protein
MGNLSHPSVMWWGRITILGLGVPMRRPLDPLATPLASKLSEVDLVEDWAWWLVEHVKVNTETAWTYCSTMNKWHERACGVGLAGGMSLQRVKGMLDGWQRLQRTPVMRRIRHGVRPRMRLDPRWCTSGRPPNQCEGSSRPNQTTIGTSLGSSR